VDVFRQHGSPPITEHSKPTTQYPSTPDFVSNRWYGGWGQVTVTGHRCVLELANAELRRWLTETADRRTIREIDARPVDRWVQERQALQPLPNTTAPVPGPVAATWPRECRQRSPQVRPPPHFL
jgi:hypothetical protein